jgi:hypothetical protein
MEDIFRFVVVPRRPVRAFCIRRQRLSCIPQISPNGSQMTASHAHRSADPMLFLRYLDLVIAILVLPIFVLADLPLAGWLTGAGTYAAQRAIGEYTTRRAAASDDARTTVGLMAGSMIGRGWLVALTIFAVGVAVSDEAGLSAAVLFIALFTVYFTMQMILRPFEKENPRP